MSDVWSVLRWSLLTVVPLLSSASRVFPVSSLAGPALCCSTPNLNVTGIEHFHVRCETFLMLHYSVKYSHSFQNLQHWSSDGGFGGVGLYLHVFLGLSLAIYLPEFKYTFPPRPGQSVCTDSNPFLLLIRAPADESNWRWRWWQPRSLDCWVLAHYQSHPICGSLSGPDRTGGAGHV